MGVSTSTIALALAIEEVYLASESNFSRVLCAKRRNLLRSRIHAPRPSKAFTTHVARAPGDVWYLPGEVDGRWFYLYLILDVYNCQIVGFKVHDHDRAVLNRVALAEWWSGRSPLNPERKSVVAAVEVSAVAA